MGEGREKDKEKERESVSDKEKESKKRGVGLTPKMKMAGIKSPNTSFISEAWRDKIKGRHINFMHKLRGSQWRDILKKLMLQYAIL